MGQDAGPGPHASSLTIREVALEAGVSTATVSRALRGLGNVDPATAEHVRRVADRLDYVVSPAASGLASGRTGSVAVLTPFIARWFFSTLLAGVESAMQEAAVDLLLHRVGDPMASSPVVADRRLRSRADGVLVLGLPAASPDVVGLRRRRLPVVLVGTHVAGMTSVSIDDGDAGRVATQHLVNLGHKRIGLIGGLAGHTPFVAQKSRRAAYLEVLHDAGLQAHRELEAPGFFTVAGGEAAMNTLLARPKPPTAVFAMSDEMAFGALRALRRHGVRAGEDVAVVGVDGHDMADLLELSTVSQPVEEQGRLGAQLLIQRLENPSLEPSSLVLPTTLCVRASTSPR